MNKNYAYYINTDVSKYAGKWIAISNNKIIAVGKNIKEVFSVAKKKKPDERPLFTRVPTDETMLF